jgi:hypothetical protein
MNRLSLRKSKPAHTQNLSTFQGEPKQSVNVDTLKRLFEFVQSEPDSKLKLQNALDKIRRSATAPKNKKCQSAQNEKMVFGKWKIFDCAQHKSEGAQICYGINDATIYGFPILFHKDFMTHFKKTGKMDKSMLKPVFQLKKNQAIVIIGYTPPPCLYWGFTPYLHKRKYENESDYTLVNSSLTDTLNYKKFQDMFNLNTSFNQPFILIIGHNPTISEAIYKKNSFPHFPMKNFDNFHRVILPLPSDMLNDDDYLTVISRVTYINEKYEKNYRENPKTFCFQFTVNIDPNFLKNNYVFQNPIPQPDVLSPDPKTFFQILRDNRIDEKNFVVNNKSVSDIVASYRLLSERKKRIPVEVKIFSVSLDEPRYPIDTGFTCVNNRYDCFFDNRDTVYSVTKPIKTSDAPNGIVVLGVNHKNTGKAIYTNINIYDGNEFTPIFDLLLSQDFKPKFVKDNIIVSNNKYFYELFIPYDFYRTHEKIFIAERAYLESVISSSFESIVLPLVFILPFSQAEYNSRYPTQCVT